MLAATTAVIAAKVAFPSHTYLSEAKYEVNGNMPRDRLKMMSLRSTPPDAASAFSFPIAVCSLMSKNCTVKVQCYREIGRAHV